MVRPLTEEKNIDLIGPRRRAICRPLFQDQAKMQQILTNLLSNAIKFTPEGGRITVVGAQHAAGHDRDRRRRHRRRHCRMQTARSSSRSSAKGPWCSVATSLTREFSGTGLGLSIVKELCKLLGGEVIVESELGKGSTFPCADPVDGDGRLRSKPRRCKPSSTS